MTTQRIPVIEEQLEVGKRTVETGSVRIRKSIEERQEKVDPALQREEVEIRRVAVNRHVDHPVATRREGDTTIVSLHEEVAVTTTQLVLTEELHICMRRSQVHAPRHVTLRREQVEIERAGKTSATNAPSEAAD